MALLQDSAVVLRRLDYSETSQIAVLFARNHGKIRVIAKGAKRSTKHHFAAGMEPLELGGAVWSALPDRPQALATLTEWKQVKAFGGLRDSLSRLYAAQYAAEISAALTEDADPHPGLFDGLVAFLEEAADAGEPLPALCRYQRLLLHEIGLLPQTEQCAACRRPWADSEQPAYFSSVQGGLLCRDCEVSEIEKRRVRANTRQAIASGRVELTPAGVFDLLNYHIACLLGREPQLAAFVVPPALRRNLASDRPAPQRCDQPVKALQSNSHDHRSGEVDDPTAP